MLPYLTNYYGNPHSRTHAYGWETEVAVEKAREQVANLIGADPKEIVFTSGATECNNIAIKGVARFYGVKKKHIITTQTVILRFHRTIFPYTFVASLISSNIFYGNYKFLQAYKKIISDIYFRSTNVC